MYILKREPHNHDIKMFASRYVKLSHVYRDSMEVTLDSSSATYLWLRETQLREAGKYDEAMEFSDRRLAEASFGTPQYALVLISVSVFLRAWARKTNTYII